MLLPSAAAAVVVVAMVSVATVAVVAAAAVAAAVPLVSRDIQAHNVQSVGIFKYTMLSR